MRKIFARLSHVDTGSVNYVQSSSSHSHHGGSNNNYLHPGKQIKIANQRFTLDSVIAEGILILSNLHPIFDRASDICCYIIVSHFVHCFT